MEVYDCAYLPPTKRQYIIKPKINIQKDDIEVKKEKKETNDHVRRRVTLSVDRKNGK